MNLPFSTHFSKDLARIGGRPTHFVEKIWASIPEEKLVEFFASAYSVSFADREAMSLLFREAAHLELNWELYDACRSGSRYPKVHTIREDKNQRWKEGALIHFFINLRKPIQFRFAPIIPVARVQKIAFYYTHDRTMGIFIDNQLRYCRNVDVAVNSCFVELLAKNDGFDELEDFLSWFNIDFSGKLIWW